MDWNLNLSEMFGEATELVRTGRLNEATQAIQQMLVGAVPGAAQHSPATGHVQDPALLARDAPHAAPEPPGSFQQVTFMHGGTSHHYQLYVPPGAAIGKPMPLVLMLHGCMQSTDDFAVGTGMNPAAAAAHALVVYPAQQRSANPNACWNWFDPENQQRGTGEPALLVDMLHDVAARHPVDSEQIYVAGMSAGGAMAAVLGREYPDMFAAVGVHSGLQAGAAHNVMAALSAMSTGAKSIAHTKATSSPTETPLPLIVFHGDADSTVNSKNGEQLVEAAVKALVGGGIAVQHEMLDGKSTAGQRFTRTVYRHADTPVRDATTPVVAEHWVLHGAGHAWSGGHAPGSLTDPRGISATQEMLRFFLEHPKGRAH